MPKPPRLPPPDTQTYIDPEVEDVVFPVRRYRPKGADDAKISFERIPVEELTTHPLFVAAVMTKAARRAVLDAVGDKGRAHVMFADKVPVGLHVVIAAMDFSPPTSLALAGAKLATFCRAMTLFHTGEYRLDMDPSRERAVIRLLEVSGIPMPKGWSQMHPADADAIDAVRP